MKPTYEHDTNNKHIDMKKHHQKFSFLRPLKPPGNRDCVFFSSVWDVGVIEGISYTSDESGFDSFVIWMIDPIIF